jgi:hypothetical protein
MARRRPTPGRRGWASRAARRAGGRYQVESIGFVDRGFDLAVRDGGRQVNQGEDRPGGGDAGPGGDIAGAKAAAVNPDGWPSSNNSGIERDVHRAAVTGANAKEDRGRGVAEGDRLRAVGVLPSTGEERRNPATFAIEFLAADRVNAAMDRMQAPFADAVLDRLDGESMGQELPMRNRPSLRPGRPPDHRVCV